MDSKILLNQSSPTLSAPSMDGLDDRSYTCTVYTLALSPFALVLIHYTVLISPPKPVKLTCKCKAFLYSTESSLYCKITLGPKLSNVSKGFCHRAFAST